jgi:hypothetical protein
MKNTFIKINAYVKGVILFLRPHIILGWLRSPLQFSANLLSLTKWISSQPKGTVVNDFYTGKRDYNRRYQLYEQVVNHLDLSQKAIDYVEFGVSKGQSFRWWLTNNRHADSKFYGFDTFEGLPEDWGTYNKGDMAANIPVVDDPRAAFIKGLFQDTVPGFLSAGKLKNEKLKLIHLDADLFSSTLYALTTLAPWLRKGDILLFDEFNVPNHEYFAFKIFSDSFYVKTRLLGAVNNYLQVALIIE